MLLVIYMQLRVELNKLRFSHFLIIGDFLFRDLCNDFRIGNPIERWSTTGLVSLSYGGFLLSYTDLSLWLGLLSMN